MKLFCAIVGVVGNAFEVDVNAGESVSALKKAIKKEKPSTITCDADDLELFLAKTDDGAWLPDDDPAELQLENGVIHSDIQKMIDVNRMRATQSIRDALKSNSMARSGMKQIHVLVVLPGVVSKRQAEDELIARVLKRIKAAESKMLADLTPLSVNEDEFQMDQLYLAYASVYPIVRTPGLHEFWAEFPKDYFFRKEEEMLWGVVKKLLTHELFKNDRVVLIGSPGV